MSTARSCPECGARVSAFAAGCASCGADLEAHARRARLAAASAAPAAGRRRAPRPALPRPELSALEAAWLAATLFAVAFVSALGIVMAVLGAMHGGYEHRRLLLAAYVALAVTATALELARL